MFSVGYPGFQSKENSEGVEDFIMKATTVPPHKSSPGKQISSDSKVMSCGAGTRTYVLSFHPH